MKKFLLLIGISGLLFTGCQQSPEAENPDLEAEEAAAREVFGKFTDALFKQDVDSMETFIAVDALICGTDPTELIDKETAINRWRKLAEGPEVDFFFLEDNTFKMASDGNSAIAVQHYFAPLIVPNIPIRNVYNLTKVDGKWMISFWSLSLVSFNDDLPKIIKALEAEETE